MAEFSTVIKNGMVFDGARNPRVRADVGIKDGMVTAIGRLRESDAKRVIDATGLHVAPGFFDNHTHYDSQLFWDPYCSISGWHGVTSVVIGNCGFSFAPVRPDDRERAIMTVSRNEAVPIACMEEGMPWDWVTFPEFLDSVDRTPKAVNVLPYMGIAPLLVWVMGLEDAKAGKLPSDEQHAEMCRLLNEAMDAGALGWSTQITSGRAAVQCDYDGSPMVTDVMHHETCLELARVLADRIEGSIELAVASDDPQSDRERVEEIALVSGRPVQWNAVTASDPGGSHRDQLAWLRSCRERGLTVVGQGVTSEAPLLFTLEDWNLWDTVPAWREAMMGNAEERLAKVRARRELLEANPPPPYGTGVIEDLVLVEGYTPETKRFEGWTFGAIIAATGKGRMEAFLDVVLADELRTVIKVVLDNGPREFWRDLVDDDYIIPGASDGGAHTKFITYGRYPTEFLVNNVRERSWLSLEDAHWRLAAFPAHCAGAKNRGVLREGAPADIIVYDFDNLEVLPHEVARDYPGGEWRRVQRARGYRHVLVNGEVTIEDDQETGTTSGVLVRGSR